MQSTISLLYKTEAESRMNSNRQAPGREIDRMNKILAILGLHAEEELPGNDTSNFWGMKTHFFTLLMRMKCEPKKLNDDFCGLRYDAGFVKSCRSFLEEDFPTFESAVKRIEALHMNPSVRCEVFMIAASAVILKRFIYIFDFIGQITLDEFKKEVSLLAEFLHNILLALGRTHRCLDLMLKEAGGVPGVSNGSGLELILLQNFKLNNGENLKRAYDLLAHTPYGFYAPLLGRRTAAHEINTDLERVYFLLRAQQIVDVDKEYANFVNQVPIWRKGHGLIFNNFTNLESPVDLKHAKNLLITRAVANTAILKHATFYRNFYCHWRHREYRRQELVSLEHILGSNTAVDYSEPSASSEHASGPSINTTSAPASTTGTSSLPFRPPVIKIENLKQEIPTNDNSNGNAESSGSTTTRPDNLRETFMDGRRVAKWSEELMGMIEIDDPVKRRQAFEELRPKRSTFEDDWKEYVFKKFHKGEEVAAEWNDVKDLDDEAALEWFFNNVLRKKGPRPK